MTNFFQKRIDCPSELTDKPISFYNIGMKASLIYMLSLAMLICGCGKKLATGPYAQLPNDAVVAKVADEVYTKGELERDLDLFREILKMARYTEDLDDLNRNPDGFRRQAIRHFIEREALVREARRRGFTLTRKNLREALDRTAENFTLRMPLSFDAIVAQLGPRARTFVETTKRDALADKARLALRQALPATDTNTLSSVVDKLIAAAQREREDLRTANRQLRIKASEAWRQIRQNADFDQIGRQFAATGDGIIFVTSHPGAGTRTSDLKPGEVSRPVETDDGLAFFRMNPATDRPRSYACLLFPIKPLPAVPTTQEALAKAAKQATDESYARQLDALFRALGAEFLEIP